MLIKGANVLDAALTGFGRAEFMTIEMQTKYPAKKQSHGHAEHTSPAVLAEVPLRFLGIAAARLSSAVRAESIFAARAATVSALPMAGSFR